jgi:tripartite motif-containing protein 71
VCAGATAALADESEPVPLPEGVGMTSSEYPVPDSADITSAYEAAKRKEEEREEELQEPAFVAEREASRHAFADAGTAEAEELLTSTFGAALARLNGDPARFLSDAKLDRPLGDDAGLVTSEGKTEIMEGTMPVEAENDEGEMAKVNLGLEETPEGYEPENPLVEVAIGASAEDGVEVGGEGLSIAQAGAEEVTGELFGDKNVFYGEVEEGSDTDLLVAPTASGVELFDMLRSVDSPEDLRFHLELPEGASLQAEEGGGAEVRASDGSMMAIVPKPYGTDAQGTYVPVTLEIEGSSTVVLRTEHRSQDLAYPILVDPELVRQDWATNSWYNNQNLQAFSAWRKNSNVAWAHLGETDAGDWPGHAGLFTVTENGSLPAGGFGQWELPTRNTNVYMSNAVITPFWRANQSCSSPNPYPEPYDYDGMYDAAQHIWNAVDFNDANKYGWSNLETLNPGIASWGHVFVIGMGTAAAVQMPCWRGLMAGGVNTLYGDWDGPHLNFVSGMPSGWIKMDNTPRTISVGAYDVGLGVQKIRLFGVGGREFSWNQSGCLGTYENQCAYERSGTITYETSGAAAYEGEQTFTVQALDPTQQGEHSQQYPVKLDGLPPLISVLGSQFANVTEQVGSKEQPQGQIEKLSLPVYNLKLKAEDAVGGAPRSGTRSISIYLDKKLLKTESNTCSSSSCPQSLEWTYPVQLTGLSEGEHTLEIGAVDFVGNEDKPEVRDIKFKYIPATGMKEEYVLQHFLLPDGHNYTEEPDYRGPELAVNVTNGNVVYHERDFQVQSLSGDLELERFYNSQLPAAKDGQWGHGWGVAQSPELKPETGEPTPQTATMMRTSAITTPVKLPETQAQETFDPKLHASIGKTASGGYEVAYETEDETSVFNASGRIEETRLSSASPEESIEPEPVFPVYAESLGSLGTGNGQFNHPADVGVDSKGNLWVLDKTNNRLEEFNEKGEFLRTAGASGSIGGKLSGPSTLAVDPGDNVWVADSANNRIEEFSATGAFLATIGKDVNKTKVEAAGTEAQRNLCTAASGNVCQAGVAGSAAGQLKAPKGIAATSSGNLWVADTGNNRMEKFTPTGELLSNFPGELKEPSAVAMGLEGSIWVADSGNNRIKGWNSSLALITQFGTEGTGNGQFKRPAALDVDAEGNIWVGDQSNNRVQEFSKSGDYLAKFGSPGQFAFSGSMGIAADGKGNVWVTDTDHNQIQQWLSGSFLFTASRLGSLGTGNGQFNHPADVGVDSKGNLWVLDKTNNRLEEFNEKGEFLRTAGAFGSSGGKLNAPSALAVDPSANVWVADTANNRIEEFTEKGAFVAVIGKDVNKTKVEAGGSEAERGYCSAVSGNTCQAGPEGSAPGQLKAPQGIAATSSGNIWVSDTGHNRMEKYAPTGSLLNNSFSEGSGPGQLKTPTAVAIGPDGSLWVADTGNNRIERWWTAALTFAGQFGTEGTGNGQFKRPAALDVDATGNIWVGDQNNNRIQEFNEGGDYLAKFGSPGQFAFSGSMGIAADGKGNVWVTDTDHNRVQKTPATQFVQPVSAQAPAIDYVYSGSNLTKMTLEDPAAPDPSLSVGISGGMASSVNAEAAGTATYAYESGKLTAEKDAGGETKYTYDASKRLTKVELPNTTWATMAYDSLSRVTEVTVHVAGVEGSKTTHFWYGSEPRETKVWGGGVPETTYSIGEDGSVFMWSYAESPPKILSITGSLWGHRNDPSDVENKDQTLVVTAESPHEIASIKVIANGNSVVAEQTCKDESQPPKHNCDRPEPLEWITNPSEHAAGRLDLEVVATDFNEHSTAERFFVTIPQQPPPDPTAPERPNFTSIKLFREEFGLDRNNPLTNSQMNRLILELLYEWEAQLPIAMRSVEQWGVPLRAPEIAELEYRERYLNQAAEQVSAWAELHASASYGGYYVDQRAGGIFYVGFTSSQPAVLQELKSTLSLIAPAQIREYPTPPTASLSSLEGLENSIEQAILESGEALTATTSIGLRPENGMVEVGATAPSLVRSYLITRFGVSAPIEVVQDSPVTPTGRYKAQGSIYAGDELQSGKGPCIGGGEGCITQCTAGYGARDRNSSELRGAPVWNFFVLTAGHCFAKGARALRSPDSQTHLEPTVVGEVSRSAWERPGGGLHVDAEAIKLGAISTSGFIYPGDSKKHNIRVRGVEHAYVGMTVCWSGLYGGYSCGPAKRWFRRRYDGHFARQLEVYGTSAEGDSGSPAWNRENEMAVGLATYHWGPPNTCRTLPSGPRLCPRTGIAPLFPRENVGVPAGILEELSLDLEFG